MRYTQFFILANTFGDTGYTTKSASLKGLYDCEFHKHYYKTTADKITQHNNQYEIK